MYYTVVREIFVIKRFSYAQLCTKIKCTKFFSAVTKVRGRRYENILIRKFNGRNFFDTKISRITVSLKIIVFVMSVQHVLKDKRVLALVQRQAAEDGGETSSDQWDLDNTYVSKPSLSKEQAFDSAT